MKNIILASASAYRKSLMHDAGFHAQCIAPEYDETQNTLPDPYETVALRARGKAKAVAETHPGDIVIGSDQGLVFGNELIGKPHTFDGAVAQLMKFRGQTADLVTSLCVLCGGAEKSCQNIAKLIFRGDLNEETVRRYVCADLPLDCAGSFKIESRGSRLFSAIECSDPTAIQGLPMMALNAFLVAFDPECDRCF